jgi:hypothetical protein
MSVEWERIEESRNDPDGWRHWGPYLADRAWGTVREDYSANGDAWNYFPHDHARSKAYRWNEDGIGGISDIRQYLCFALTLWNERDAILKERLFGLNGPEGNHGEDVKEYYFYLDATPTASYLKFLYKYPQTAFPYSQLVEENRRRDTLDREYELLDTGIFEEDRYFDVCVEYAKAGPEDIAIRITATNRGPEAAPLHLLPTLWFRNRWSWNRREYKPELLRVRDNVVRVEHPHLGVRHLICEGETELLFTENETNVQRLYGSPNPTPYRKDAFHNRIVVGDVDAVNPEGRGTKAAAWYRGMVGPGETTTIKLRLRDTAPRVRENPFNGRNFDGLFTQRIREADEFYARFVPPDISEDARRVQRQAYAGLIWSKQYYRFDVSAWLEGDPGLPPPPPERKHGRNAHWTTVSIADVLAMPDKWEYPWFAAWDHAFHMIPFAQLDPDFAKHQLILMCREWYMHPNGQLPAYEWAFNDVNPPVHAWAALRVYQIERKARGIPSTEPGDTMFLEKIFHKLLLNFTWWVNRKDTFGNNIFEGGFLGLDNIGIFDRSSPLPTGGVLEQCDGTSWMAMFCLDMLAIALELTRVDPTYEDVAVKFAEHFVYIAYALNNIGDDCTEMWDEDDGFYYDVLHPPHEASFRLKVRSIACLTPLFAVEAFPNSVLARVPDFYTRFSWFLKNKPHLAKNVAHLEYQRTETRALFSILTPDRLRRLLRRVFDPNEFLGPYGIRSLSRYHAEHPYVLHVNGTEYRVDYTPAESTNRMFGGNSNWRGPVWFPLNFLLIEALQRYDYVFGESFTVEYPTGSGSYYSLGQIARDLSHRLSHTFLRDETGRRPVYGGTTKFQNDPHWRDHLLFYEYFHGDNGAGLGASHQTGWTALVAKLIAQSGE